MNIIYIYIYYDIVAYRYTYMIYAYSRYVCVCVRMLYMRYVLNSRIHMNHHEVFERL